MGEKSNIEWTDASWNPVTGCSKVSPGCASCYAEALSLRRGWSSKPWTPANAVDNVILHPERLTLPIRWYKPRRIFVNSMSDLFHEQVPDAFIDQVFAVMALATQHTFQVLTKRPERMHAYLRGGRSVPVWVAARDIMLQPANGRTWMYPGGPMDDKPWPLPNVWLGTSVENQRWADVRIPLLLDTPAAVRFLSCEPLLGPVDLSAYLGLADGEDDYIVAPGPRGLQWIITGGESGPDFRPFNPDWARQIRDQCVAAGVAYFHKQHGGRTPKAGGRLLDGVEWSQFPEVAA